MCDTIVTINPWIRSVGLFLFLAGGNQGIKKLHQNTQKCEKVTKSWFSNISGSHCVVPGPTASSAPGNVFETQILMLHPRPTAWVRMSGVGCRSVASEALQGMLVSARVQEVGWVHHRIEARCLLMD